MQNTVKKNVHLTNTAAFKQIMIQMMVRWFLLISVCGIHCTSCLQIKKAPNSLLGVSGQHT